jgi:hypothetical protein
MHDSVRVRQKTSREESPAVAESTGRLSAAWAASPRALAQRRRFDSVFGSVKQAKLDDDSDYTNTEKRAAIADAGKTVKKKKAKDTDYADAMATFLETNYPPRATGYKNSAALKVACKQWWNKPSLVDDALPLGPARTKLAGPTIEYDAEHGDLHFGANPTSNKSAWTLSQADANALCEARIREHLGALGAHSGGHEDSDGWSAFYITAAHGKAVGVYAGDKKGNKWPSTTHYSIQLQVNYAENLISYHGFPDERIEGHALGCSINKTDNKKLEEPGEE